MWLSSITPMPRIVSPAISIVGYKYERRFQRLIDEPNQLPLFNLA